MKKHLRYLLTLLLVMVASVGWAQTYNTVAQFSSSEVVTGSGYKAYSNDDWSLSFGGNNLSVGTNKGNSGNCVITDNYGTGANTENNAVSIVSKNKISKVSQITFTYSGGSGYSGKIYLAYSTDNVTWTAITLTTGEQGSNAITNMTFQFDEIASAYYAVILDKGSKASANWRWDNVNITFDELESTISTVSTPTFTPAAGTYNEAQDVEITTSTDGATIYYTTDGSDPTTASSVYSAAIPVTTNTTIKAYAVKDGMTDSEIAEAAYVINYEVATPIFTPAAGTYNEAQNVTITTETDGATIYYTTDGTDPDETSTEYTAAIPVAETMTIKAIAVKDGYTDSEIATAEYTIVDTGNWVFDELTYDLIGVSGTNYTTWSEKSTNSSLAVYAGNSAGGNESIQLRSTNSNSGIVTTKSGGKAKQVVVIWNSNTASGRTLDVYGKNTAYSTAADLYSYDNKGDKLGSIAYGETTLTIEGDYEYIGVRSYSGAMYLDAVKIAWEPDTTAISVTIGETEYATLYYSDVNLTVPEGVTAKTYKANGTALVELDNYSAGNVIPAGTGVVLNGAQGDYTFAITTESGTASEENMLRGSDEAAETTGGAKYYMLSLAATGGNETVGFYYKAENRAAFMNGAHKAYLAVPEGTEAKATGYAFNEVTGINDITREQVTDGVWYTIDGKRLNGEPTVKGIYVVNGKKVVIK